MKRIVFGIICCCLWAGTWAQEKGVLFQNVSFQEGMQKAGEEKKLVFIDFYTEWCGPCKMMAKEVFPQQAVGDFINPGFVCLKVDAEKGEGIELARRYAVRGYPTFVILKPDGTEVYRTSGARPAEEFIEKIRKGIDPEWSPEGLTRRYEKGERSAELVKDYAILQMENGKGEEGRKILEDYFNALPDKKRVRAENFFLYEEFALGKEYLFSRKKAFVRNNGLERVENLLARWLRGDLLAYVCLRSGQPVTAEGLRQLKEKIVKTDLTDARRFDHLLAIAEARMSGDIKKYLEVCKTTFPLLDEKDRFSILLNFSELKNETPEVKKMAAGLIRENLDVTEGFNRRILNLQMAELEGSEQGE